MKKNADEKILDYINEMEAKEKRKDICSGPVKINNCFYEFKETEFFEGSFLMYIPNTFIDMPEKARKFKYPSENRPKIIKCNDEGSTVFSLNIIDSPLDEDSVEELKDGIKVLIRKTNPANIFYEDGVTKVNEKNIGYFEFKSPAIDEPLYNLMFFLEFKEKTLMGTFSCRYKEYKEWREAAFEVLKKIRVIKEK